VITDASRAYEILKEKIITLELPPGSVIQDFLLIAQLGLGRTPIREALKLLEAEKLVTTVPRRGVFVSQVSITDLQQISEIRVEVEGLAARLAAQRATDEEIAALRASAQDASLALSGRASDRIQLDRRLHFGCAALTRNRFLESEVVRFYDLSLRLWNLALERVPAGEIDVLSHVEILAALERRDADQAEARMQEHVRVFQQLVKAAM
jgi:DNA-binding GntR family transcriptional regulator